MVDDSNVTLPISNLIVNRALSRTIISSSTDVYKQKNAVSVANSHATFCFETKRLTVLQSVERQPVKRGDAEISQS